jgi:hypothetical protein
MQGGINCIKKGQISAYGIAPGQFVNDPNNPINRIWVEESLKWAAKRPNIQYKVIKDSGHHIAKHKPEL